MPSTDWNAIHHRTVDIFRSGWQAPTPDAWDGFLDQHSQMVQPMLRDGIGAAFWHDESARALGVMPDLRAEVLSWSGLEEQLFIHLRFHATVGGRPLSWDAVDLLQLRTDGSLVRRDSFFDSVPVARALATRPRAWWPWWRSGLWPLEGRRRILDLIAGRRGHRP